MDLFSEIQKSFPKRESFFKNEELEKFAHCTYKEISAYHFGLGTWIRNHLLHDKSTLYKLFIESGISHRDDMSDIMISLFYIYLRSKHKLKKENQGAPKETP